MFGAGTQRHRPLLVAALRHDHPDPVVVLVHDVEDAIPDRYAVWVTEQERLTSKQGKTMVVRGGSVCDAENAPTAPLV